MASTPRFRVSLTVCLLVAFACSRTIADTMRTTPLSASPTPAVTNPLPMDVQASPAWARASIVKSGRPYLGTSRRITHRITLHLIASHIECNVTAYSVSFPYNMGKEEGGSLRKKTRREENEQKRDKRESRERDKQTNLWEWESNLF